MNKILDEVILGNIKTPMSEAKHFKDLDYIIEFSNDQINKNLISGNRLLSMLEDPNMNDKKAVELKSQLTEYISKTETTLEFVNLIKELKDNYYCDKTPDVPFKDYKKLYLESKRYKTGISITVALIITGVLLTFFTLMLQK